MDESHHDRLRALGDLTVWPASTYAETIQRLQGADIAIGDCFDIRWDADLLKSCPTLKFIQVNSTGYDGVDVAAAKQSGILAANVPGFGSAAVAEQVFALLLAVARRLVPAANAMQVAPFEASPFNPDHKRYEGFELRGKTIGIVGLGAIGREVARIALGFGMKVIASGRSVRAVAGVENVAFPDLLAQADVISLNVPLTPDTRQLIDTKALSLTKRGVVIINTARGECVNSYDLAAALDAGIVFGAGLDVLDDTSPANPLLGRDNVVITPHNAFSTREAVAAIPDIMIGNIEAFLNGRPVNLISA